MINNKLDIFKKNVNLMYDNLGPPLHGGGFFLQERSICQSGSLKFGTSGFF
jgi:hypothetical protein